jgi:type III secretion protein C
VATLNDLEAVIESSRSLYVPVKGAFEVDLFQVFAGTVLRVTPHVINDGPQTRIRLIITVEDGTVDMLPSAVVSGEVPVATRNAVNTQAIINSGHSLLLGGLVRDEESVTIRKVPFLGDLPVIGWLFRSEAKGSRRSERMFLISPRLITSEGEYSSTTGRLSTDAIRTPPLAAVDEKTLDGLHQTCKGSCREEFASEG